MIDVNVSLGRWPFRRVPGDEPATLGALLRDHEVSEAWAGGLDALLHEDVAAVNARLAETCRTVHPGLFLPFGTVNPTLPDWREDLRRCVEVHRMPGVRLHPNYHGYALDDPEFAELLDAAARRRLVVQLAVRMEDERTQHPLVRVPPVNLGPLPALLDRLPGLRLVLLNAGPELRGELIKKLIDMDNVSVEIAMLEGIGGVERLLDQVAVDRVLFGSHAPVFVFEAARLKLKESPLTPEQHEAIIQGNARRILGRP